MVAVPSIRPQVVNRMATAVVAGFVATVGMTLCFFAAYGVALILGKLPFVSYQGGANLTAWFAALADNAVIDVARSNLAASLVLHFGAGIVFAVVYLMLVERRLFGVGWQRGVMFALVPWALSLIVFFPLVGAGMFGMAIGAGPLPIIGNLVLHVVYGAVLGEMCRPSFQDSLEEDGELCDADERAERRSFGTLAAGIVVGGIVGTAGGYAVAATGTGGDMLLRLGLSSWFMVAAGLFAGASWGGLLGSLFGLNVKPAAPARAASELMPKPGPG
ncbi:MAG: hypothetical protein FJ315_02290 [SAR202 cluster bacterium]|nr:hypothetical protein [SAR202 cluster bacterium]